MLEPFLRQPVIVETPRGQVVGVLVYAGASGCDGVGTLLVHEFRGSWHIVKTWSALKTARSS